MTPTIWLMKKERLLVGHTFFPDKKARNPACPSLRRCKQYQNENGGSVKTFRELSIKASTNVVNETKDRPLKPGKNRCSDGRFLHRDVNGFTLLCKRIYLTM